MAPLALNLIDMGGWFCSLTTYLLMAHARFRSEAWHDSSLVIVSYLPNWATVARGSHGRPGIEGKLL